MNQVKKINRVALIFDVLKLVSNKIYFPPAIQEASTTKREIVLRFLPQPNQVSVSWCAFIDA